MTHFAPFTYSYMIIIGTYTIIHSTCKFKPARHRKTLYHSINSWLLWEEGLIYEPEGCNDNFLGYDTIRDIILLPVQKL